MEEPKNQQFSKWQVVSLAFELGFIIALPIILLGLLGKYLDVKWGTDPYLKLAGVLLAITVTTVWMSRRFAEIFKSLKDKPRPFSDHLQTKLEDKTEADESFPRNSKFQGKERGKHHS